MTHEHDFSTPLAHIDGCHTYVWTTLCKCGAVQISTMERSPEKEPYALAHMDPDCVRCNELGGGAEPIFTTEIAEPQQ